MVLTSCNVFCQRSALWLVPTLVSMLRIAPSGMCSFRMVGDSRESVRMDKIRWYEG
jgi:hypothetical protein